MLQWRRREKYLARTMRGGLYGEREIVREEREEERAGGGYYC